MLQPQGQTAPLLLISLSNNLFILSTNRQTILSTKLSTEMPMAVAFALALQRIGHAREEQALKGLRPVWRIGQCVDEVTAALWLGTQGVAEILNKGPNPTRHDLAHAPDEVVMAIMAHIGRATQIGDMARTITASFVECFFFMTFGVIPNVTKKKHSTKEAVIVFFLAA
jgi:hypothetical protein